MAPNSKKRRKATSSPQSPTSNRGTPARSEDHSQTRPQTTSAQVDSDNNQQSIDVDSAVVLCFGFKYQNVHILGYRIQWVEVISNPRAKQVVYREVQQSHQVGK
ncbi:hypothetical protein Pst134EA_024094 [Puccinia striiformis f. sp. tritici]|uniref:hypothetical protein n=1 Tax=Puccinia striiformis f. sp. tritici TaxID=168172 RepID=UPI00200801D5|nr:hypothetical protein Pst134EA_024094 [Puccinia striiformis f. sp. tritici]KAH9444493.1 hypothetical protein Pst134EB_024755 [Puccinia striiformis f. sp. tritici]KAH9453209.1 hypothetical protein Pst134EA_024094 [Puccinia striiformis f. sp. tritici]KAI9606539.1 hypothetical protein H4Q26_006073 [Puccinia striiformis f. sp. tritici PST-130]